MTMVHVDLLLVGIEDSDHRVARRPHDKDSVGECEYGLHWEIQLVLLRGFEEEPKK